MSDVEVRAKQRKAKLDAGDAVSAEQAEQALLRVCDRPYDHLIGHWILINGVRQHYRGHLIGVSYLTGGKIKFLFDVLYDLANYDDDTPSVGNETEQPLKCSRDYPAVLNEDGVLTANLQPDAWPKR